VFLILASKSPHVQQAALIVLGLGVYCTNDLSIETVPPIDQGCGAESLYPATQHAYQTSNPWQPHCAAPRHKRRAQTVPSIPAKYPLPQPAPPPDRKAFGVSIHRFREHLVS
jgi:hypothetical protein